MAWLLADHIADYLGSGGVGPQVFAVILHNEFLGLESMDKEKVQAINLPFECKQAMKISRAVKICFYQHIVYGFISLGLFPYINCLAFITGII